MKRLQVNKEIVEYLDEFYNKDTIFNKNPLTTYERTQKKILYSLAHLFKKITKKDLYVEESILDNNYSQEINNTLISLINLNILENYWVNYISQFNLYYVTTTSPEKGLTGGVGTGIHPDINTVFQIALGELIERYSCIFTEEEKKKSRLGKYKDFDNVMDPIDVDYFNTYKEGADLFWTEAFDIKSNKKIWIPSNICFFDLSRKIFIDDNRPPFCVTTNGVAVGQTKDEAEKGAILELLERDAWISYWSLQQSPRQIDIKTIKNKYIENYIQKFQSLGIHIHILVLETEFKIPTICCLIFSHNYSFFNIALSINTNIEKAIIKVLYESAIYLENNNFREYKKIDEIRCMEDIRSYWFSHKNPKQALKFLIEGEIISFNMIKEEYKTIPHTTKEIKKVLKNSNFPFYLVTIENELLSHFNLYAARCISPSLIQIYFGIQTMYTNHPRFESFAKYKGLSSYALNKEHQPYD